MHSAGVWRKNPHKARQGSPVQQGGILMTVRRFISFILILTLIVSIFAGCSKKQKDKNEDPLSESGTGTSQEGQPGLGGSQPTGGGTLPSGYLLLSASEPPNLDGFLEAAKDPIGTPGKDFQLLKQAILTTGRICRCR